MSAVGWLGAGGTQLLHRHRLWAFDHGLELGLGDPRDIDHRTGLEGVLALDVGDEISDIFFPISGMILDPRTDPRWARDGGRGCRAAAWSGRALSAGWPVLTQGVVK
jgi:hypothetical protein